MIFSNLNSDLEIFESVDGLNMFNNQSLMDLDRKFSFPKLLKTLSQLGMRWDDLMLKNMKAIPLDKSLIPQLYELSGNIFQSINDLHQRDKLDKNFFTKDASSKMLILRKMALQPELEDILDTMSDECIVYDDNSTYICNPYVDESVLGSLNEHSAKEITNAVDKAFYKIYSLLNFKKGNAWYKFKKWLVDGELAFEIVYDDLKYPKNIIGIVPINPGSLTKVVDKGVTYWIQNKGNINSERTLIDALVIYIKYEEEDDGSGYKDRQSYLERLVRPFNVYRIIEQAQIIWTVTQSSYKTVFTIPIGGMNRAKGAQTLNSAMNRYKEDISFNAESGELMLNGKMNLPFSKEYWFPEGTNGKPTVENLTDGGPSIADNEQLRFFLALLYKSSKIPSNRFDNENQQSWFGTDPTQYMRDEIKFGRFVKRLRNLFGLILIKPIQIQLTMSIPNIKADKRVLDAISLQWNSNNQFEEMMDIELKNKRLEFINNMKEIMVVGPDGEEEPYFSTTYLVKKYLRMTPAEEKLNEKLKKEERELRKKAGVQGGGSPMGGGGSNNEEEDFSMGGGEQPENGEQPLNGEQPEMGGEQPEDLGTNGEITQDMLGTVQPESEATLTP